LHRIGGLLPLHARSLVPLVKARDFGMTSLLENFAHEVRDASNNRVGRTLLSDAFVFVQSPRTGHEETIGLGERKLILWQYLKTAQEITRVITYDHYAARRISDRLMHGCPILDA
jgi:hypothetical protein